MDRRELLKSMLSFLGAATAPLGLLARQRESFEWLSPEAKRSLARMQRGLATFDNPVGAAEKAMKTAAVDAHVWSMDVKGWKKLQREFCIAEARMQRFNAVVRRCSEVDANGDMFSLGGLEVPDEIKPAIVHHELRFGSWSFGVEPASE